MALPIVAQGLAEPIPQQAVESSPLTESTARTAPGVDRSPQQLPPATSQKSPVAQLLSSLQVARQAVAPQMNGVQSVVPGAPLQLPFPSHRLGFCWVLPLQLSSTAPQGTLSAGYWQAPLAPSQSVAPQGGLVLAHCAAQQWPVPLAPQGPEVQSSFSVQAPREILPPQAPALQTKPGAQSALLAQVVAQTPPSAQAKSLPQLVAVAARHVPWPLQFPGGV
jgi:hypothetical protein